MLKEFRSIDVYWDKATRRIYEEIRSSSSDEKGRKLTVQIVNDGQIQDLTSVALNLYWETQDGENRGLDPFTALDPENGIYELYFRTGMLEHVGKLNAHLHLVDTTGAITSEPFTIFVFQGVDVDAMASEDELSALNQALIEVQNIKQDEAERVSAETERITAEEERVSNENERKTAETTRNTNETTRVSNETDRVNAEDIRIANETNRVNAENNRVAAETARVTAEEEREQGYPALDGRITTVEQNLAWTDYIELTLLNGWTGSLRVRKNAMEMVFIYGEITPGATARGTTIASVPSIYRPARVSALPAQSEGVNIGAINGLAVTTSGNINIYGSASEDIGELGVRINYIYGL